MQTRKIVTTSFKHVIGFPRKSYLRSFVISPVASDVSPLSVCWIPTAVNSVAEIEGSTGNAMRELTSSRKLFYCSSGQ